MKKRKGSGIKEKNQTILSKISILIENIIYFAILIPLVIITLMIVFQQLNNPDKIPDIFGWKMFIILDENMDDSIKKGDLVFTKNINSSELNIGDVIAFRNDANIVTIHKIIAILEKKVNEENQEERLVKSFIVQLQENQINNTIIVKDSKVEGILVNKIPYVRINFNLYATTNIFRYNNSCDINNRRNMLINSQKIRCKR